MLSVGFDLHKRYSQVEALEDNGERRAAGRLVNEFEQIEGLFRRLGEPCRVVLEAGWNWGAMYGSSGSRTSSRCSWRTRTVCGRSLRLRSRRTGSTLGCWGSCSESKPSEHKVVLEPLAEQPLRSNCVRARSESASSAASPSGSMVGPAPNRCRKLRLQPLERLVGHLLDNPYRVIRLNQLLRRHRHHQRGHGPSREPAVRDTLARNYRPLVALAALHPMSLAVCSRWSANMFRLSVRSRQAGVFRSIGDYARGARSLPQ
jgi:hypothetical protein